MHFWYDDMHFGVYGAVSERNLIILVFMVSQQVWPFPSVLEPSSSEEQHSIGSEHISVFSWKQVWQHGKPIHKYLQTIVSICSCFFLHGGVLKICPEKGFVCGLTTFIVEIRISRWLCRIRVSKWTSLDVACFRDAYRCWTMELIYLHSWKAASNGRCHRHIWTSSALDFWRSTALNHGGCLVSALDSDRMYVQDVQAWQWRCLGVCCLVKTYS